MTDSPRLSDQPPAASALHLDIWLRYSLVLLPPVGMFGLIAGFPSPHWAVQAFWVLWTSYFLFCWTSVFHETAHQLLPRPKQFNVWLGRMIGTGLLTPYTVYRESHIRHHAYLNRPDDWELWPYSDPNCSLRFRRVFVWLDLFCGFLTAPYTYGRIYFHKDSPITRPQQRRTIRAEYAFMALFWVSTLTWVTVAGYWSTFLLVWGLPHWLAGVMQNGRKLTEHLGMASFDPLEGTRTVVGRNVITRLCSFLNHDIFIHGPHHRYPRAQHDELESKMAEHLQREPNAGYPTYGSYLAATRAMLPCLIHKPGVGLNAGAETLGMVHEEAAIELHDETPNADRKAAA